jgi:hypothetical protein
VIKQVSSLDVVTIGAIAAVVLCAAASTTPAHERIVESPWSNSTVESYPDGRKNRHNGNDSLNPDPFLSGPDPYFCIECTWPEGSPTYHGSNGG